MPRIFDNIDLKLLPDLQQAMKDAYRADFCVGYFNLRGWKHLDQQIDQWQGGEGNCVRLLVGMQKLPQDELKQFYKFASDEKEPDNQSVIRLKRKLAEEFRLQLAIGAPSNDDEQSLRKLATHLRGKKVIVKLYLRSGLHAKLYLFHTHEARTPILGYLGSSNLTFAGLSSQGELNIDVLDSDASAKLSRWFDNRWEDRWCIDITDELAEIIETSWAGEQQERLPYHVYIKMAYHLSQEARTGLNEFRIPKDFGNLLFDYQTAAVKIAAHHLNKRDGVLIGDVVGLGKTLMATALARIFEDDYDLETLIICPKNLVKMWEGYRDQFRLRARVLSSSLVLRELADMKRYRIVVIDESHNLRNREGKTYKAIQEYIQKNESKVILLSATPYNKTYLDLSNQIRLFLPEDKELPIRPEQLLKEIGEAEFVSKHQCGVRTLAAFEKSEYPDDWRELMRLYMVRRTRNFIKQNYAHDDGDGRKYLLLENGTKAHFPIRRPKTVKAEPENRTELDQYSRLYSDEVVDVVNSLALPRYGLGNYIEKKAVPAPTAAEKKQLDDLSRAGKRLMGFSRTNLFKRLESSGSVFLESIERHILRNHIFLYALENNLPLPLGTQDASLLDTRNNDEDADLFNFIDDPEEDEAPDEMVREAGLGADAAMRTEKEFKQRAKEVYELYQTAYKKRFKWLSSRLLNKKLKQDLGNDAELLLGVLNKAGTWDWTKDDKFNALYDLITKKHKGEKVLIFTQFADTVRYLEQCLKVKKLKAFAAATGGSADPTALAWRFSPVSNGTKNQIRLEDELRVLVATDVLSEGQNLQDCYVVINYDLPWAIVRLIQRAGRVDRIGQQSDDIYCYSFLPAEGVEKIIRLRARVKQRLKENAEVVGSDESFFEGEDDNQKVVDLYNEKAGILDGDEEGEVDLASYAYQIWKNAITLDPSLQKKIPEMSPVSYATKSHLVNAKEPQGAIVYLRTAEGNDALTWIDTNGNLVTDSQYAILKAAECAPNTPPRPRQENHHELVRIGVENVVKDEKSFGGNLGRPSGARSRTYVRLQNFIAKNQGTYWVTQDLIKAVDDIYKYPLRESAREALSRQLRAGIEDQQLAELVVSLRGEDRLSIIEQDEIEDTREPQIICSLGIVPADKTSEVFKTSEV
ncbi:MAG: helicase-related protein [Anaerolineales bacterium]|nr:MAG: helicase-related protein [Anaerolineales bacterium]